MEIQYTKSYEKSFKKLDQKIKNKAIQRIALFSHSPFDKISHNHKLLGKYNGYHSINVTGDFRAIFREYPDGSYEFVEFIDV